MTEPTMELLQQIEEFERLRNAATQGEWIVQTIQTRVRWPVVVVKDESYDVGEHQILEISDHCAESDCEGEWNRLDTSVEAMGNADFAAYAANNLPTFLIAVRERLEEIERLNAEAGVMRPIVEDHIECLRHDLANCEDLGGGSKGYREDLAKAEAALSSTAGVDLLGKVAKQGERIAELEAELKLWKPMTNEEIEVELDKYADVKIDDAEIDRIVAKVTDPAYRPPESEYVRLCAKVRELRKENAALRLLHAVMSNDEETGDGK